MAWRRYCVGLLLLVWLGVIMQGTAWSMNRVDNSIYAELLKRYVKNGVVDYAGFKKDQEKLDEYLKLLEQTDTKKLSLDEQLAFYINAYNAWTIKLVLSGYPGIHSIKDLGSFWSSPWKKEIVHVDGKVLSLDDIEHGIIRPKFKDPRIHFAVNCASKSCPPLSSEPYEGKIINQQLDAAAGAFINDLQRNRLEGNTLYTSKIFDWYGEDFKGGIVNFFLKYAEGDLKRGLEANKNQTKIRYLDYDWSLNGK